MNKDKAPFNLEAVNYIIMQTLKGLNSQKSDDDRPMEESRRAWDKIAIGYSQFVTDTEIWLANEALKLVDLKNGQDFLDVAAGCGGLSLPAARMGAKVFATDWSPEMIKILNKRAKDEQLLNITSQVMDGHHLEIEDNFFDVSASQFGVMLFSDQPGAIREMVRVTKPKGKVLLIVYGVPEKIEFLNFFVTALQSVRPKFQGLPSDPPPMEFQASEPRILNNRLKQAGLKNTKVDIVLEELGFRSGQQLWDWIINGNPIVGNVLSALELTNNEIELVKQQLQQLVEDRAGKNDYAVLRNEINIGIGIKP